MIGGDLFVNDINMNLVDDEVILFDPPKEGGMVSSFAAWAFVVNLILVYDHNFLPAHFNCGLLQAILIGLAVYIINTISFWVYMLLWKPNEDNSYAGIWTKIIGKSTDFIPRFLVIIGYFYFIIEFMNALTADAQLMLKFIGIKIEISNTVVSYSISILTFIFFGPYVDVSKFMNQTYLFLVSCFWLFCIALYLMISNLKENGISSNFTWWNTSVHSFDAASTYSIDLFMHPFNYIVYVRMINPTYKRCLHNAIWVQTFTTFWLLTMGTVGYLTFTGDISSDPVYWKYPLKFKLMASIPNFFNSFTSNGAIVNLIQREFSDFFIVGSGEKLNGLIPCSIFILLLGGSLIYWPPSVRFGLKLIGDVVNCLLSYIFPYFLFFIYYKFKHPILSIKVIFYFILGILLTTALIYIDVIRMKNY